MGADARTAGALFRRAGIHFSRTSPWLLPAAACPRGGRQTLENRETPATCEGGLRADPACPHPHLSIGYDHLFIFLSLMTSFLSSSPDLSLRK
jgi:hypothetical protein